MSSVGLIFAFLYACISISMSLNNFSSNKRQCDLEHNCVKVSKAILIAVGGTGSKDSLENSQFSRLQSSIGVNKNQQWIWHSHIANFWEDYQGESSFYFHGPDTTQVVETSNQISDIIEKTHDIICNFIDNHTNQTELTLKKINDEISIHLIGFSRGGFAVMELSRVLQKTGCIIKNTTMKPIHVKWMGLYDPVQRDIDLDDPDPFDEYNNKKIADNVMNICIAERDPIVHSRISFGYAVHGFDSSQYPKIRLEHRFFASHSGIGGRPGYGDCKDNPNKYDVAAKKCSEDYTEDKDKESSVDVDIWMRFNAMTAGVPITQTNDEYYGNFSIFIA